MKKFVAVVLSLCLLFSLAACAGTPQDTPAQKATVRVYGIKGPTAIGMTDLMEKDEAGTAKNDYTFELASSPDEVAGKLSTGTVDIAAIPTNLAANLYAKTNGNVIMLAANTQGTLTFLENGNTVQSVADLRGKTVYGSGQGSNTEYILRYILTKNGIDPDKDLTINFVGTNDELSNLVANGTAKLAMIPQPAATAAMTKNADLRVALDINAAWNAVAPEGSLIMGCVVVRKAFLEENKAAVDTFLTEYKASIEATADVDATAALCEKYGIIAKAALAKKAIPQCNIAFLEGADMQTKVAAYLQVLFDAKPQAVGGAMPDDAFYYSK